MSAGKDGGPVRRFTDPRVEIFEPTGTSPYFRIRGFDDADRRVVDTTGGRTLREAQAKAAEVTRQLRAGRTRTSRDPRRVDVRAEAALWLDPANNRTRGNRPWSRRHADNVEREWRLRIEPELPRRPPWPTSTTANCGRRLHGLVRGGTDRPPTGR